MCMCSSWSPYFFSFTLLSFALFCFVVCLYSLIAQSAFWYYLWSTCALSFTLVSSAVTIITLWHVDSPRREFQIDNQQLLFFPCFFLTLIISVMAVAASVCEQARWRLAVRTTFLDSFRLVLLHNGRFDDFPLDSEHDRSSESNCRRRLLCLESVIVQSTTP